MCTHIFFHSAPEEGLYCKPKYRVIFVFPRAHVSFGQHQDTELWNNQQCRSQSQRVFDTAVLSKPNFLQRVLNALVERIHVDFISGRRVNQGTHAP